MERTKSSAQIFTADGEGGLRAVTDYRFDAYDWPITHVVQAKDAAQWMAHLAAESEARGWHSSGLSQIDAEENSGSLSVHTATGTSPRTIEIAWDKARDKTLRIRARTGGSHVLPLDVARDFFFDVDRRQKQGTTLARMTRELSRRANLAQVVFNNNYEDQGQRNARTLTTMLNHAP